MRIAGTVVAMLLLPAPMLSRADSAATLPEGWTTQGTPAYVKGLFVFAKGTSDGARLGSGSIEAAREECWRRYRLSLEIDGDPELQWQYSYWLYRTPEQSVLFVRSYAPRIDAEKCRVSFEENREVRRYDKTDGIRTWPWPFLDPMQSCVPSDAEQCARESILGVRASCRTIGDGSMSQRDCFSIERGPTFGMRLAESLDSDGQRGHSFEVEVLDVKAKIERSIFEPSSAW